MNLVVAWAAFPLIALAVAVGCGLLVERAGGAALPGLLIPSLGLAAVIVIAAFLTRFDATAELTTAAVLVVAAAGWTLGWRRLRHPRLERWPAAVGAGLFAVMAAPVVLTGDATFLGYFTQNDTAIYFGLLDHFMERGREYRDLAPSTQSWYVRGYVETNYPMGTFVGLGALRPLTGQDVAWMYQPWLAVLMTLNGLALYEMLRDAVRSAALRALSALVAGQAALLYGYYIQATGKEVATAWVLTVTVAAVFATLARPVSWRSALPLGVLGAAGLAILNLAIAPWLAPPFVAFAVGLWWSRAKHPGRFGWLAPLGVLVGGAALLAAPVLAQAGDFIQAARDVLLSEPGDPGLGNLLRPLEWWQLLGVWPKGDYRLAVSSHTQLAFALMGVVLAAAVLGVVWAVRRRALGPLVLVATSLVVCLVLVRRGTVYADGKAMAIASPAVLVAAMMSAAALDETGRRLEAWLLAAVIAGGVLWTNALQYGSASPAPRDRLSELDSIDRRFAGDGPTLYTQVDEFVAHFLRRSGGHTGHFSPDPVRSRAGLPPRPWSQVRWDINDMAPDYVQRFRLLVTGSGPLDARPPANYRLVRAGRWYDVWRREPIPRVVAHEPVGALRREYAVARASVGAVAGCAEMRDLAARARTTGGRLAYVERAPVPVASSHDMDRPADWPPFSGDPLGVTTYGSPGTATARVDVPRAGRYDVWLYGTFDRALTVFVGGRRAGRAGPRRLGPAQQAVRVGAMDLPAGRTRVAVRRPGNDLAPGHGGTGRLLGPLVLHPAGDDRRVRTLPAEAWRRLCGRRVDWVEIIR